MRKKRIYLVVEVQHRELDARILFSIKAAEQGYSVVFCKKAYLISKSKYLIKGIVILKSIGIKNLQFIKKMKNDGHIVCSFDEEGLLFHNAEIYCKKRIPEKCLRELKYFFAWGKNDSKAISSIYPNFKNKIKIVGNSRVELLKSPFKKKYITDSKIIKKKYGSFVLINTKFGYANYMSNDKKLTIVDVFKKLWKLDYREKNFYQYILNSQIKRRNDLIKILKVFEKDFSNVKFLIRPHQSEDQKFWEKIKYKNVKIIRDPTPSLSWMLAAKVVVSFNCTTAIEAKFFNVDHINYIPMAKNDFILPNKINKNIYDYTSLKKEILKNFKKNYIRKVIFPTKIFADYIENLKTDYVNNIITVIDKIYKYIPIEINDKYINIFSFYYFKFKRFVINFYYFKLKKRFKELNSILLLQKNPATSLDLIRNKSFKFMKLLKLKKIYIKELYPDVYCFEKINES